MKAVILAGGEGTRLRPLTIHRPKPMVPVCNRPVLEHTLALLRRHGVETAILTLQYLAEEVVSYFGDGSEFGIQILYSVEDEPLGTAGSVKRVEGYLDSTFLVLSGDALTDFDLGRLLAFHREKGAEATLMLARVQDPLPYGVVVTDPEARVTRLLEKPSWGEVVSDTVNTGIYCLEPSVLAVMEPDRACDFAQDLLPQLLERGRPVYGHTSRGYWCDIGDLEHYRRAHQDMFAGRVLHELPGKELSPGIWVGDGTVIDPEASLEGPLVIGRDCRILARARLGPYSCLGDHCIVEEEASLDRDLVWNNVYIGRKVRSSGTIVGRQCTLKAGVTLSEGVVLGENVFVGRGALLFPHVRIWPDKHVEDGATVSLNLIWGTLAPGTLFGVDGVSGLGNIEITPEFALKLGAAYGSLLEKSAIVATSRDTHPGSRLINRALICGLTSVGVQVLDLRHNPAPVSRYVINKGRLGGGIHTRVHRDDPRMLQIEVYDPRGIHIEKRRERQVENLFAREDFRRTQLDEVGTIEFTARALEQYQEGFTSHLDTELIRQANFKVVIDYSYGNASAVLPTLFGQLGTETISLNAYLDAAKGRKLQEDREAATRQLSNIVTTLKADLGVLMDLDAERLTVVDEAGRILAGNSLLAMLALMIFRENEQALVAVPITAPRTLEELAARHGGRVIRTRSDSRSLMHTATLGSSRIHLAGTPEGAFIFPSFSPGFDALFTFARLLEMMARERSPLSELARRLPPVSMREDWVECSWQHRGKVMRLLSSALPSRPSEVQEGLRLDLEAASTLILPHPTRPRLQVWVEGQDTGRAEAALEQVRATIRRLQELDEGPLPELARAPLTSSQPLKEGEKVPPDRAFHFWVPGRHLGVQARSLREFVDVLHYVEPASLDYHLERDDFATWVEAELRRPLLARNLRRLGQGPNRGETLRGPLLELVSREIPGPEPEVRT